MALTTVSKVIAYLGITTADTQEDAFISDLIDAAEAQIEKYCKRHFKLGTYVEKHMANHVIATNEYPIKLVSKVERISYETGLEESSVEITSYKVFPSYIELNDDKHVTLGGRVRYLNNEESEVRITYTAGFEENEIPADLSLACTKLAVLEYKESREGTLGVDAESEGDVRYTYSKRELPSNIRSILDSYKKRRV